MKNIARGLVLFSIVSFLGCGNDTPPKGEVALKSARTASKVVVTALGNATFGASTGAPRSSKPSSAGKDQDLGNTKSIREALENFKTGLNAKRQKPFMPPEPATTACSTGGTQMISYDAVAGSFSQTYSNCKMVEGNFTSLRDGSLTVKSVTNPTGFEMTATHYSEQLIEVTGSTSSVTKSEINGKIVFSGQEDVSCGDASSLNGTITFFDFTSRESEDKDGDEKPEWDESEELTDFTLTIEEAHTNCIPQSGTIKINGKEKLTDHLDPKNDYTASYNGLTIIFTPATKTINGTSVTGEVVSIDGTVTITACGQTSTITLKTEPGELALFIPEDKECPVSGELLVINGGTTSKIIATSMGGVKVDDGNDGTIDKTFENCEDIGACV